MITPPRLKKGDKIAIVAPARKIPRKDLEDAVKAFESWGLVPVFGKNLFKEDNQYSGTDAERLADLQEMCDDPEIKAVMCARGGYGTLRIHDGLSLKGLKRNPKWVIGFSDITALLVKLYNAGMESLHAPMCVSWDGHTADGDAIEYLRKILIDGGEITYSYTPDRQDITRPGRAEGRLLGGNLSLLSQFLGTETDFDTKNTLFFFEDLAEYLYHIDRMMVHLKRGGKFERPAALIVGGMSDMLDNTIPFGKTPEEIIWDAVKDKPYPVCYGFPTGHWPKNYPLIVGREAELRVTHSLVELKFQA